MKNIFTTLTKNALRGATLIAMLILIFNNVWGETTVEATQFTASQSGTTYTVSAKSGYGNLSGVTVTTVGANGGVTSNRLKVPAGTLNCSVSTGNVITSVTISWRNSSNQYPTANSQFTVDTGSVSTSSQTSTWTGSAQSIIFTNTTSNTFQIVGLSITYSAAATTKRIYMKCGDTWCNDSPKFYAHSWGSSDNDVLMTRVDCETDVYYADIPSGNTNVLFTRQDPSTSTIVWSGTTGYWNQSENITISTYDLFTCTGWNNGQGTFSRSTYSAPTYTISFNNGSGSGTMTALSGIACGTDKAITANSFTKSGYSFTGWHADVDVKIGGSTVTSGTLIANSATLQNITSNITLTAQWEEKTCPSTGTLYSAAVKSTVSSNQSFIANSTTEVSTSQADVSGGKLYAINGESSAKNLIANSSGYKFCMTNNSTIFHISLDCPLQAGDIITIDGVGGTKNSNPLGLWVSSSSSRPSSAPACYGTSTTSSLIDDLVNYTVTSSDEYVGKSSLYIHRAVGSSTYFNNILITRPASCTAPTAFAKGTATITGCPLTITDDANTNNYDIYYSTSSTAPTASTAATTTVTSKTPTLTGLTAGTQYYAWVRSVCAANSKSSWRALTGSTFTTASATVTHTLTNVTTSGATTAGGGDYTAVYAAASGYSLPTPTVTIGGSTATSGTDYKWTAGTGTITISLAKITGNIVITLNSAVTAPTSVSVSGTWHIFPGETMTLTAEATGGNGPKTYQWYHGGTADGNVISGATSATYTKANCTYDDAGDYYCKVTCGGTESTTSAVFQVKMLRIYVMTGKYNGNSKTDYGNADLTKVDATTATASISLGANWDYCFYLSDGCGGHFGYNGELTEANHGPVTTNVNNQDCGLHTTNGATYEFTFDYSDFSAITTTVTFPSGNQAAGKVIYFDNSTTNWSNLHYRIGRTDHTQAAQITLVPGTANLYSYTTAEYNNFTGWHIANNAGWTGDDNSIYRTYTNGDEYSITYATAHEGGAVTADAVTVTPTTSRGNGSDTGINDNCDFYNYTLTTGMKTDNVAITAPTNGTITVAYTDTEGTSQSMKSGNAALAHTCILTVSAAPATGYQLSSLTVNGTAHISGNTHTLTSNATIAATFTAQNYSITYKDGGDTAFSGTHASGYPTSHTYGTATTLKTATKTGYTFGGWYDNSACTGTAVTSLGATAYTAGITLYAKWTAETYSVTHTLSNVTASAGATGSGAATYGTAYTATFAAATGYALPSTITVTVGGTTKTAGTDYTWNSTTGTLSINAAQVTGNIVITVTAEDVSCFRMVANATASTEYTLSIDESITQGAKNCVTLIGGTAKYIEGSGMKVEKLSSGHYGWYYGSNSDKIAITLEGTQLQTGSVISVSGTSGTTGNIFKINGVTVVSTSGSSGNFSQTYTVKSTDTDLVGKYVLNITRGVGSATRLFSITISNCAERVAYNVTYKANGGVGSDVTNSVSTVEDISDVGFTRAGYDFTGWKTGASSGTDYAAGDEVPSALTLYAQWSCVTPTITTDLSTAAHEVEQGDPAVALTVAATANGTGGNGTVSYQWYSNTIKSTTGATALTSGATYNAPTSSLGTLYYYCVVTNSSTGCATTAQSEYATVTVTEAPCFKFKVGTTKASSGWDVANNGSITTALWTAGDPILTGGTITNTSGSSLGGNASYGLVFAANGNRQVTVSLSGDNAIGIGSVITISGYSNNSTDACGFTARGQTMSPATYTPGSAEYTAFTQTYTVTAGSSLVGAKSFTIDAATAVRCYLKSVTVTGCIQCTPFTPTLSYGNTTLLYGDVVTPSLTGNTSGGAVTYSSSNTDVVTVNASTGVVTAVGAGAATVTATIAEVGDYCSVTATANFTVPALVTQNINVGASTSWGTTPNLVFSAPDGVTLTQVSPITWETASPYTFEGTSTTGKANLSAKFTGANTTTPTNYLELSFSVDVHHRVLVKSITVPIQPVSKALDMKIVMSDNKGSVEIAPATATGLAAGSITRQTFTLDEPQILKGTITLKIYAYNQSTNDGFRIGTPITIFGNIAESQYTFTGATDDDWNKTSNWDEGVVPTDIDNVLINAPAVVSTTGNVCNDLSMTANGSLEIATSGMLKVVGTMTNSDYTKLVVNLPGGIAIADGMGSVKATANLHSVSGTSANGYRWQAIGWPFTALADVHNPFNAAWVMKYLGNDNWDYVTNGNGLNPFQGYLITHRGAATSGRDFTWGGTLNGDATKALNLNYYGTTSDHWNFVANSWLAPIDVATLTTDAFTNADATVYILNTGSQADQNNNAHYTNYMTSGYDDAGQYTAVNHTLASASGGYLIAPGQGFFVAANNAAGGTLTLNYANHVLATAGSTSRGSNAFRAPRREQQQRNYDFKHIVIKVHGTTYGDVMHIFEGEQFTTDYDNGADARKAVGMYETSPQLCARAQYGDMTLYATPDIDGTLLGFRKGSEENSYTITFDGDMEPMYITDLLTGVQTLVTAGSEYQFTTDDSDDMTTRFRINRSTQHGGTITGIDEEYAEGYQVLMRDGKVTLISNSSATTSNADIRLFDAAGRMMYARKANTTGSITLDLPQQGVYLLRIGSATHKIVW